MEFKRDPRFGRMIPAMVTPFNADLELDLDRAQELADRLVRGGADALIVNGTTGESPTVFYPQKLELFRAVVRAVNGRIPGHRERRRQLHGRHRVLRPRCRQAGRRWLHVRRALLQ